MRMQGNSQLRKARKPIRSQHTAIDSACAQSPARGRCVGFLKLIPLSSREASLSELVSGANPDRAPFSTTPRSVSRARLSSAGPTAAKKQRVFRSCVLPAVVTAALGIGTNTFAADVEPVVVLQHTSDLFRGRPVNNRDESQEELIAAGVTIRVGKAFEIDLVHGAKRIDRGEWEGGSQVTARWYPGRHRETR